MSFAKPFFDDRRQQSAKKAQSDFAMLATKQLKDAHSDSIWGIAWTSTNEIVTGSIDEDVKSW